MKAATILGLRERVGIHDEVKPPLLNLKAIRTVWNQFSDPAIKLLNLPQNPSRIHHPLPCLDRTPHPPNIPRVSHATRARLAISMASPSSSCSSSSKVSYPTSSSNLAASSTASTSPTIFTSASNMEWRN
ncbi:hypothetical protein GJ744_008317 [Endocarpon pusillum]|uniref:Uncharacterized protein n=1 Tax=Endocarpon pusillum TaxID=364733 RepID=A0A8H7AQ15_9EURO|nr:hypothetical protein GJ744_008317 [Endocarpon pusillum]